MSNFKAGAFFDESNIVEVGLKYPDAPADGDGGLYARDVVRGVELPGGGSGDFSTAKVTIKAGTATGVYIVNFDGAFVDEESIIETEMTTPSLMLPKTLTAILYKGEQFISWSSENDINVTVESGSATTEGDDILITGDCVLKVDASTVL